jgi:hypothetical protein
VSSTWPAVVPVALAQLRARERLVLVWLKGLLVRPFSVVMRWLVWLMLATLAQVLLLWCSPFSSLFSRTFFCSLCSRPFFFSLRLRMFFFSWE